MNDLPIRRRDPRLVRLARNIPPMWRSQVALEFPNPASRYIELRWVEAARVRQGYLNAQVLLAQLQEESAVFPAEWVDERLLLGLAADFCQRDEADEALRTASVVGVVSGADLPSALYRLSLGPKGLLLSELPACTPSGADPEALQGLAEYLRWPLTLCLGRSQLVWRDVRDLARGDVLLLTDPRGYARIPGKTLFYAQFDGEALVMTEMFDPQGEFEPSLASLDCIAAEEIPVEIEFVLAERSYTLAQLSALAVGDVLELGDDAARHIRLRAGNQLLAEGELIALDERLGVELTRIRLRN